MIRLAALACALAAPALADAPRVLADVAPVHSLVAMVMAGVPGAAPEMIVAPGQSPHDSGLQPAEAAALEDADVVIWTGPALLPWVAEAMAALAPDARVVSLLDAPGWTALPARADGDDAGHAHGPIDPHAWLDPAVAAAWLAPIATALAAEDPANAALYAANADAGRVRLLALGEEVAARLAPVRGRGYATGHDAYRYFERAADLQSAGAIAPASGAQPSPGDLGTLREAVLAGEVACVLTDAESDPSWAAALTEGTPARTAAVDADGVLLTPGPDLYPTLILGLVAALEGCLR